MLNTSQRHRDNERSNKERMERSGDEEAAIPENRGLFTLCGNVQRVHRVVLPMPSPVQASSWLSLALLVCNLVWFMLFGVSGEAELSTHERVVSRNVSGISVGMTRCRFDGENLQLNSKPRHSNVNMVDHSNLGRPCDPSSDTRFDRQMMFIALRMLTSPTPRRNCPDRSVFGCRRQSHRSSYGSPVLRAKPNESWRRTMEVRQHRASSARQWTDKLMSGWREVERI